MNAIPLIAGAVLNSLWQAVALTALVWLAIELLELRLNAATRHAIWWIALAAVIVLPFVPRSEPPAVPAPRSLRAPTSSPVAAPLAATSVEVPVVVTHTRRALWPFFLLLAWATLVGFRAAAIVRSYFHLRAIKRRATPWTQPLPNLTRNVRLLESNEISSPIAAGFLRPAIVLPENLRAQLNDEELRCVLLHECAHLARYDDWSNLLARLIGAVTTPHPAAWWILRQIEREREIACDDWVVAQTGVAHSYAEALARVVELKMESDGMALATGLFTGRSRLRARIELLLRHGRRFSTAAARVPIGATVLVLACLAAAGARVPHWIAFAQRLEFEVASVKPNLTPAPLETIPRRSGDLVTMHNGSVYSMIFYAYHLTARYQLENYPDLPEDSTWYDIDARIGRDATDDEVRMMMQSLLEGRFKLKIHRESRVMSNYELTLGKSAPRLQPSTDDPLKLTIDGRTFTTAAGHCGASLWLEGVHLVCHTATMEQIAGAASNALQAPVVDRTGLTGKYDLNVLYMRDKPGKIQDDVAPAPTFLQAFPGATGLKLVKGKGPVEVLVIDHMEKPSEN